MNSGRNNRSGDPRPRLVRALKWTSLIMLLLSLYEIGVRWSDLSGEVRMVAHLVRDGRLTWGEFLLTYMWDLNSFPMAGYMVLRALLSLWALSARCGRRACAWMILPAALLTVLGFTLRGGLLGGALWLVSMLPLLLFLTLCVIHVSLRPRKGPGPERRPGPGPLRDGRPVR